MASLLEIGVEQPELELVALLEELGVTPEGFVDPSVWFSSVSPLRGAGPGSLTFLDGTGMRVSRSLKRVERGAIVLVSPGVVDDLEMAQLSCSVVRCEEPRAVFTMVLRAIVDLAEAAASTCAADVAAGGVVWLSDADLAESDIAPNCTVSWATTGRGLCLGPGTVIGSDGVNLTRSERWGRVRMPQVGIVRIGSGVSIGANSVVSRGTLDETTIGNDVIINSMCHIGHNCQIGDRVVLRPRVTLSGSVSIGSDAVIGAGTTIKDHVSIGRGAFVGLGSVVVRDVPDAAAVFGVPACPLVRVPYP
jgi:UDP-3-O-[3-hydroxymyristoyl] glucosamine N-acyltransferase